MNERLNQRKGEEDGMTEGLQKLVVRRIPRCL